MAAKNDVKKLLEERLVKMNADLDKLEPGSAQYSILTNNMCKVAEKLTAMKQAADQAEDNTAKREETKRVNDEELRIKNEELNIKHAQLDNETIRIMNEGKLRNRIDTGNLIVNGVRTVAELFKLGKYEYRCDQVMALEYQTSGGTSYTPPANIQRMIDKGRPKSNI